MPARAVLNLNEETFRFEGIRYMPLLIGMKSQSTEFTCVLRLANCFVAAHFDEKKKEFISTRLETDLKVAQTTAKLFAKSKNISYDSTLYEPKIDKPILTIIKQDCNVWFPAAVYADRVNVLTQKGPLKLGGSQQEALSEASLIASFYNSECLPFLGTWLPPHRYSSL